MEKENVKFGKRFIAYLLDILLVYLIISLILGIRFINPNYDKYMEYLDKYNDVLDDYYDSNISPEEMIDLNKENFYYVNKYSISYNIIIIIVIIGYFALFQKYNNGQTIGKKIMKIKVTNVDEEKEVNVFNYILRTISTYYLYIGNVIALLLNILFIYIIPKSYFMIAYTSVTYIFIGIAIISLILIISKKEKRGIHDYLAKTKVINEN